MLLIVGVCVVSHATSCCLWALQITTSQQQQGLFIVLVGIRPEMNDTARLESTLDEASFKKGILLPDVLSLENFQLEQNAANIQYSASSLDVEISSIWNPFNFIDEKAFHTQITTEIGLNAELENVVDQGQVHIYILYSFRSASKAIPEVVRSFSFPSYSHSCLPNFNCILVKVIEAPEGAGPEDEAEIAMKRAEINRKIVDILRPGMMQMKDLLDFITDAIEVFNKCFIHASMSSTSDQCANETLFLAMIKLLDLLIKIDNLKDIKASIKSDFSRYKRAFGSKVAPEALEEIMKLQDFLSSPDTKKAKRCVGGNLPTRVHTHSHTSHSHTYTYARTHTLSLSRSLFYSPPSHTFTTQQLPTQLMSLCGFCKIRICSAS